MPSLGSALPSLLLFMFETNCYWEIDWQKIDLSDGFWRMIMEHGKEYNFVYQLPPRPGDRGSFFVVPSGLQMGWTNSPAYFCTATEGTRELIRRILALSIDSGIDVPHRHEQYCVEPAEPPDPEPPEPESTGPESTGPEGAWVPPETFQLINRVFVDDFMNGLAGEVGRKRKREEQLWVSRATMHGIHAVFPPPDVLQHEGGRDSISERKLEKGDARFKPDETLLGFNLHGHPKRRRTVGLDTKKSGRYRAQIQGALGWQCNFVTFNEFRKIHGKVQHAAVAMPCMRGFMTPLN